MSQSKEAKRLYDIEYRRKNKELIKAKKRKHYLEKRDHYREKEKERRSRPENKKAHNEYCMRPEYVEKKALWDKIYRSMKKCGEFWESDIILIQLEKEIRKRIPKNERLYYTRNVDIANQRNIKRRLEKAICKIRDGRVGTEILSKCWVDESRQILEMELSDA